MITKKVNRYYCEWCKKSGCAAGHMRKHEERCTLNPGRKCGVCGMLDGEQRPMVELVEMLPNVEEYKSYGRVVGKEYEVFDSTLTTATNEALPRLREVANNCPACILAAIRQAGIPVELVTDFDWKTEMEGAWAEFNERQRESSAPHEGPWE